MTNAEVKNFLDSITAMVAKSNEEIVSVTARVSDVRNGVDRDIKYSVQSGASAAPILNVSLKDIYDRLWKCRDFEISLVWTRATFMTAFLLGCFVAYGNIVANLWDGVHFLWHSPLNGVAACTAAIAFALAVLWIGMAKGSKAWYEVYESAISAMGARLTNTSDVSLKRVAGGDWWCVDGYIQGPLGVRGFKGDAISVSKVIIAIGYFFTAISGLLCFFHISCACGCCDVLVRKCRCVGFIVLPLLIMGASIYVYLKCVRSGVLNRKLPKCEECQYSSSCKHAKI